MIDCMLVGYGRFGVEHLLAWETCPDVQISAIVDPAVREKTVQSPTSGRPIAVFSTIDRALGEMEPEAAAVVTPNDTHHEVALSLIAKGIHCLVEKPLATSAALARAVECAVNQHPVVCMPGHTLRFSAPHLAVKRRVQTASTAPARLSFRRDRSAALSSMYDGNHPVLLTGVHDIDLAYWIAASPVVQVSAQATRMSSVIVGFDAECRHASGARTRIRGEYGLDTATPDAVDDEIRIVDAEDHLLAAWHSREVAAAAANDALLAEVAHFVDVVTGRVAKQAVTVSDAVHVIEVAEAIVRSADHEGRTESVPKQQLTTE